MNAAEYRETLDTLQAAARAWALQLVVVSTEDLRTALRTVEYADAFGPIFHPTEWRAANSKGALERQRALLAASLAFRAALLKLWPADAPFLGVHGVDEPFRPVEPLG